MKILVTGGAGFIGSHLAETLAIRGHEVTVLDSLSDFLYPSSVKKRNLQTLQSIGIRFVHADLITSNLEKVLENQQVVINQAALPGLVKSWVNLNEYTNSNLIGLGRLLDQSVKSEVEKFIQISTSSVYGKDAVGGEDSIKQPFSPYGVTKLAAENLCKAYEANFGIDLTILRYYSVYGPRQRPDMAYFKFIHNILNQEKISIFGDGSQVRTNTYIEDVIEATIAAISLESCPEEKIFNISGTQKNSLLEVIGMIENILGTKAHIDFHPKQIGDQETTIGVISRATKYLNWNPKTEIIIGLEKQILWQRNMK
jgi:UDP-glucuronate 4-epimerase